MDLCRRQDKFIYIRKLKKSSCEQWSNLKIQNDGTILHNSPIFLLAIKREQNAKFSNCQNKLLLILKSEILFWAQKKYHSNLNYWLFKIFIVSLALHMITFQDPPPSNQFLACKCRMIMQDSLLCVLDLLCVWTNIQNQAFY